MRVPSCLVIQADKTGSKPTNRKERKNLATALSALAQVTSTKPQKFPDPSFSSSCGDATILRVAQPLALRGASHGVLLSVSCVTDRTQLQRLPFFIPHQFTLGVLHRAFSEGTCLRFVLRGTWVRGCGIRWRSRTFLLLFERPCVCGNWGEFCWRTGVGRSLRGYHALLLCTCYLQVLDQASSVS
jgi:hypothetical protein